jgi:hypothetical protein
MKINKHMHSFRIKFDDAISLSFDGITFGFGDGYGDGHGNGLGYGSGDSRRFSSDPNGYKYNYEFSDFNGYGNPDILHEC